MHVPEQVAGDVRSAVAVAAVVGGGPHAAVAVAVVGARTAQRDGEGILADSATST